MGFRTERQGALGVAFPLAFSFYSVQHFITSFNEYIDCSLVHHTRALLDSGDPRTDTNRRESARTHLIPSSLSVLHILSIMERVD